MWGRSLIACHRNWGGSLLSKARLLIVICILLASSCFVACTTGGIKEGLDVLTPSYNNENAKALPLPDSDIDSLFGIDKNINISTIDSFLGRDDVEYIDVRLLFDPADFAAIGGDATLSRTIKGFRIVPYPFIASLAPLPVDGAYMGNTLYKVHWQEDGTLLSAEPNFLESLLILEELFPKNKALFLMCGGGGYSAMMKSLLIYLGWDEDLLYNIGANWEYKGANSIELVIYPEDAKDLPIYATWRANYAHIEFALLNPLTP